MVGKECVLTHVVFEFLGGDDFWKMGETTSAKNEAWFTAASGPSNASSNSLSSLGGNTTGSMSKNSSVEWGNPNMASGSLFGGKKEQNGIGWPSQSNSSLTVEWGSSASTGASPSLWESPQDTGGGEPATTNKGCEVNVQDPFGGRS